MGLANLTVKMGCSHYKLTLEVERSVEVFIVFVALGLPFPQVHLYVGGGGGGGGAQQASSLSSKHKLEFPQVLLVILNLYKKFGGHVTQD